MNQQAQTNEMPTADFVIANDAGFIWSRRQGRFVGLSNDDATYYLTEFAARRDYEKTPAMRNEGARVVIHPYIERARAARGEAA